MATLTPTLALTSTDASSDALSLSVTDNLDIAEPIINLARKSIATGSAQSVLAANSSHSHVYLKVASSSNAAAYVLVQMDGNTVMKLRVEEFAFFPFKDNITLTAEAYTASCVLEYAQYSNG